MPAHSTDLELVISCSSASCLINMEPLELLRLQPNEPIASESVESSDSRFWLHRHLLTYVHEGAFASFAKVSF